MEARELKNRLSDFIRLVEAGESFLVTDRGTVVAELRPAGSTTSDTGGAGASHDPNLYVPRARALGRGGTSDELLASERGDR